MFSGVTDSLYSVPIQYTPWYYYPWNNMYFKVGKSCKFLGVAQYGVLKVLRTVLSLGWDPGVRQGAVQVQGGLQAGPGQVHQGLPRGRR